jgi:hypothetical protein
MLSLRWLVTGFRPRRLGFEFRVMLVEFMVDKVALGQVYLRLLRLSLASYHSTNASHTFINRQGWWRVQQAQECSQCRGLHSHLTTRLKIALRYICIKQFVSSRKSYIYNKEKSQLDATIRNLLKFQC